MRSQVARMIRAGFVAAVAAAAFAGASAPALADGTSKATDGVSQVFVVHGIPGQPVDVYVNGEVILSDFQPGEIGGPLELAAGSYDIAVTAPGAAVSDALISVMGAEIPAGASVSLVAHLTEAGDPTLTPFVNDVSEPAAGQARITVRHTAAAPPVDVRVNGEAAITDLANPQEATAELPAGTITADVVLAGTDEVVIGPADLTLDAGTLTIVYAIGSAEDGTLDLVVQVILDLAGVTGVPAGIGGLAATGATTSAYLLAAAGVLLLVGGGYRVVATRRAAHR